MSHTINKTIHMGERERNSLEGLMEDLTLQHQFNTNGTV